MYMVCNCCELVQEVPDDTSVDLIEVIQDAHISACSDYAGSYMTFDLADIADSDWDFIADRVERYRLRKRIKG